MKISQPDTKVKLNRDNVNTFVAYLSELLNNEKLYFQHLPFEVTYKHLIICNLKTVLEKLLKVVFKNLGSLNAYKVNFKFSESERYTILRVFTCYNLPMDINFIEYELKKNLLK